MPRLCVIEGDGIGQEVIPEAVRVLEAVVPGLEIAGAQAGWECFRRRGVSVPAETMAEVHTCGAALFGAVSSPSYRVEGYYSAILTLRQSLDLYANIRPVRSLPRLSPRAGVDMILVRENTEGLYAGRERLEEGGSTAIAERVITRRASERLAQLTLRLMRQSGRRRLTIVHKANILPLTDGLFRDSVRGVIELEPESTIQVNELLVDVAAYLLAAEPERFDTIITTNLFGDILSDEAACWMGGMGLAPSLNWGQQVALAEPVHGSAPDIAGKGIANPIAAILSAALLARYAWENAAAAQRIERAVEQALAEDLPVSGGRLVQDLSTGTITQAVLHRLADGTGIQPDCEKAKGSA